MQQAIGIEQMVLEKLRSLSPEKQQEVLDFVEFLQQKSSLKRTRRSLKGLWADLNVDISSEDITQVRCEMWGNFSKESLT
jgi:putative lipoic acid-binding regulatory protein